jgi:hypothetical protein
MLKAGGNELGGIELVDTFSFNNVLYGMAFKDRKIRIII